jgi:hypothetical protein
LRGAVEATARHVFAKIDFEDVAEALEMVKLSINDERRPGEEQDFSRCRQILFE